jgi:hypothetical protein
LGDNPDRELRCGKEIVIRWSFPVNYLKYFGVLVFADRIAGSDLYAIFQEGVDFAVGFNTAHKGTGAGELLDCLGDGILGSSGIEAF